MSKLVTRRVRRGKHVKRVKRGKRSRCGGKHSKRKGYSKYKKHYTRKYGRRNRTRTKRGGGGKYDGLVFNFNNPHNDKMSDDVEHGRGFAEVTKLNKEGNTAFLSEKDRLEQLVILQLVYSNGNRNDFRIYRCPGKNCEGVFGKIIQTKKFTITRDGNNVITGATFYTDDTPPKQYRIKLIPKQSTTSLNTFFTETYPSSLDKNVEQQHREEVSKNDATAQSLPKVNKPRDFTLNYLPQKKFHDRVLGEGYVLVTKLNDNGETAWNTHEDDLQQMAILQKNDPVFGLQNFRIFKCRGEECDNVSEMSTNKFSVNRDASKKVLNITFSTLSTPPIQYRLKLMPDEELSTLNFFFGYYDTKPDVKTGALIDEDAEAAAEAEAQNSRVGGRRRKTLKNNRKHVNKR